MVEEERAISWSENIKEIFTPPLLKEPPFVSIIIPLFNAKEALTFTLESIKRQAYRPIEVIIVDAGSKNCSLGIARSYAPLVSQIDSVTKYDFFEMLNRGISLAQGEYITFLFPGSCYLSEMALSTIMACADQGFDLIYCGGRTLASCVFKASIFERIGKFNLSFPLRADFDFLLKIRAQKTLKIDALDRIYVDDEILTSPSAVKYFSETCRILYRHFGFGRQFLINIQRGSNVGSIFNARGDSL